MNTARMLRFAVSFCLASFICHNSAVVAQNLAGDEALSKVLVDGEGWQLVGEGYQFTDAACGDAEGNFYFADLPKGHVYRVTPDGKPSLWWDAAPNISGLKFGPDGRLYAATQGPKKQIVAITPATKEIAVIADDVQPNDLVVTVRGFVFYTDTGKGQVIVIPPGGQPRAAASGINRPNGISLSPDSGTLVVSEYGGTNVWAYRVELNGDLTAGAPYMTLRAPVGKADSGGDGMTTDAAGRYYVTSHLGIQMFDWTGREGGLITKPQNKGCVSAGFGGPNAEYLYVCNSDKVYRRKTKTRGAYFYLKP